jgi:putative ABC transport system permease protein
VKPTRVPDNGSRPRSEQLIRDHAGPGLGERLANERERRLCVALRTREIGIRAALGASRRSIVTMILRNGMRLALAGGAIGIVATAFCARMLQSFLYETAALSAPTYAGAMAFVMLVAMTAAWLPARRAAGVSAMTALRED